MHMVLRDVPLYWRLSAAELSAQKLVVANVAVRMSTQATIHQMRYHVDI